MPITFLYRIGYFANFIHPKRQEQGVYSERFLEQIGWRFGENR